MQKVDKIILGGGCFWCIEAIFNQISGVQKVVSGYIGGDIENPTYEQVCGGKTGHAEAVEIYFDTDIITLEKLLEIFWICHNPTTPNQQGNDIGSQYRSCIFYFNEAQKETIQNSAHTIGKEYWGNNIVINIVENMFKNKNLLPNDGEVFLLDLDLPVNYFEILKSEIKWKQDKITIYDKIYLVPRLTAWYGTKSYIYSKIQNLPLEWTPNLLILKKIAEQKSAELGHSVKFNSVLLNYYRDGNDSISYHSDNEKELGINPIIASFSFGDNRIFSFRHKINRQTIKLELQNNTFLLMAGQSQENWEHQISKTTKSKSGRINLTFRNIK